MNNTFKIISVVIVGLVMFIIVHNFEPNNIDRQLSIKEIRADFQCLNNKKIKATFLDKKVVLKLSDGRHVDLEQSISASGARYTNRNESVVFWNKGNTAFIEENGIITFADCIEEISALVKDFRAQGVIVYNNPGLKPNIPYLIYEVSGQPALNKEIIFKDNSICLDGEYGVSCLALSVDKPFLNKKVEIIGLQKGDTVEVKSLKLLDK